MSGRLKKLWLNGAALVTLVGLCGADSAPSQSVSEPATRPAGVADPAIYLSAFCKAARIKWPKNHTLTLVFHGHSVPAGYAKTPLVRPFDAYPHLLRVRLCDQFPMAVLNVTTTAIGGEASDTGAARFARDVLPLRPDVVFIDYALNDRRIGVARAKVAWQAMIDQCRQHNIPVILLTPTIDLTAKLSDPNDPLNQLADMIRTLAAANHVGLVDSLAAFKRAITGGTQPESLMAQRNHPNRQGHELVAAEL
ncbi:MAG: SGNH/GDSL hydrolase family protein, partial [Tepidisphaeraceae bacterium]